MQLDRQNEIEAALLSMDYNHRAALLVCSLCSSGDGRDIGDAVLGLLSCAAALSARLDDGVMRGIVCRRLDEMITNLCDDTLRDATMLH